MRKIVKLTGIIIFLLFILSACMTSSRYGQKAIQQPNTKWASEDNAIVFYVNSNDGVVKITGTMLVNEEIIDIYISEDPGRSTIMHIFPASVLQNDLFSVKDRYGYWTCSYISEDKFIATVEETTFFEVGEKITFNKIVAQ